MPNPASLEDVQSRWKTLAGQEAGTAQTFLDDAWVMLKRRLPDLETRLEDNDPLAAQADLIATAVRVLCSAVIRVLKNPDGAVEEDIDDHRIKYGDAGPDGVLGFTQDELDDLSAPAAGVAGKAFSIDLLAGKTFGDEA